MGSCKPCSRIDIVRLALALLTVCPVDLCFLAHPVGPEATRVHGVWIQAEVLLFRDTPGGIYQVSSGEAMVSPAIEFPLCQLFLGASKCRRGSVFPVMVYPYVM